MKFNIAIAVTGLLLASTNCAIAQNSWDNGYDRNVPARNTDPERSAPPRRAVEQADSRPLRFNEKPGPSAGSRALKPVFGINVDILSVQGASSGITAESRIYLANKIVGQISQFGAFGPQVSNFLQIRQNGRIISDVNRSGMFAQGASTPRSGRMAAPNVILNLVVGATFIDYEENFEERNVGSTILGIFSKKVRRQNLGETYSKRTRGRICVVEVTPSITAVESGLILPFPFSSSGLTGEDREILQKAERLSGGRRFLSFNSGAIGVSNSETRTAPPLSQIESALRGPISELANAIRSFGRGDIVVPAAEQEELGEGNFSLQSAQVLNGGTSVVVAGLPTGLVRVGETVIIPLASGRQQPLAGQAVSAKVSAVGKNGDVMLTLAKPLGSGQFIYTQGVGRVF